jgi:hypothetical protein
VGNKIGDYMRLIWANEFIYHLMSYRVLNIRGGYGKGKTLLAVAVSYYLYQNGYVDKIYANFPLAGKVEKVDEANPETYKNFVMDLDEAHVILDARQFSKNASQTWLKDLRKRNAVLILPAVLSVDNRFRTISCQRMLQLGNWIWVYRWMLEDGIGDAITGTFGLQNPSMLFGAYDTEYIPSDEDFEMIRRIISNENKVVKHENKINDDLDYGGGRAVENQDTKNIPSLKEPKFSDFIRG